MSIASPELIIGAVVGGITAAINGGSFGDILMAVAIGAVVGAVSGGVYTGLESYGAMAAGMGAGAAGGATAGALGTAAAGGGKYFKNITNGAFFGAVAGAVTGGMMQYGGVDSTIAAMTGSFASGTMRGGIDDGLIAMAYAAGASLVSYGVKGAFGEPKPKPIQQWDTNDMDNAIKNAILVAENDAGLSFDTIVVDTKDFLKKNVSVSVSASIHLFVRGWSVALNGNLNDGLTVTVTDRYGPGLFIGAGGAGSVGQANYPAIGSSAEIGSGLSVGAGYTYGGPGDGLSITKGLVGYGFGAYTAMERTRVVYRLF